MGILMPESKNLEREDFMPDKPLEQVGLRKKKRAGAEIEKFLSAPETPSRSFQPHSYITESPNRSVSSITQRVMFWNLLLFI